MDKWKDIRPNRLVREVSPYLLQHAYNPVNWYPWCEEAFEKARNENKLVIVSIGYSSCHWCHVMGNESFSDASVAKIMNERYVCIKVDREERPDVDQIYMNAVQIITRRGGWPLNCFTLPDGRPIYGGTYFPKDHWISILESLNETWQAEPEKVLQVADELTQGIVSTEIIKKKVDGSSINLKETLEENIQSCKRQLDFKTGGTGGAPKFPMSGLLKFLLTLGHHSQKKELKEFVFLTLGKIASGGIYDHVGGGFFRYSVDDKWFVPHFEKMLYDNAQLVELYSLAYRTNPNPLYQRIVEETLKFVERNLLTPDGVFYSGLDADTAGLEGGYYTWTKSEVDQVLGADSELFNAAYGVTPTGNWEQTNIIYQSLTTSQLSTLFNLPIEEVKLHLRSSLSLLNDARKKRIPPLVDDKVITSWNALMIKALVSAYQTFNNKKYLKSAQNAAIYLLTQHQSNDNSLLRVSCKGKTYGNGLLDDYAYTIDALLNLFEVTRNDFWLDSAENLLKKAQLLFADKETEMFYYTPEKTGLIVRKMELMDGVMPSASAIMVKNLYKLGLFNQNAEYTKQAQQILTNVAEQLRYGHVFVYEWANQLLYSILPVAEVKGKENFNEIFLKIQSDSIYPKLKIQKSNSIPENFLLCIGNTCQSPTNEYQDVTKWINAIKYEYY